MSICLFSIPDSDINAPALEVYVSEYDSTDVWLVDLDEGRVDMTWTELRALAQWVLRGEE